MSAETSETESESEGMPREREVQKRRRIPKLTRLQKDVLKCSITYLIASLFTFVPSLSCLRMCPPWAKAPADREVVICSLHLSSAGTQQSKKAPSPRSSNPYSPSSSAPYNLLRPLTLLCAIVPLVLHNDLSPHNLTRTFLFNSNPFTLAKQAAQNGGESSRNVHEPQTRFRGGAFGVVRSVVVIICGTGSRRNPEKGEVYDAVDCLNRLAQHFAGLRYRRS
ncbi:hypothetical protein M422DRAFT_246404 [Sphaerobolus stellatus SS14]|nr:hypothetical protein M422DRAFT_246404 [Sphaerobolus stellatus SS14]